jgi:hypothetical protein
MLKNHHGGVGGVFLAAMIAVFLSGVPSRLPAAEATRAYDIYMGFSAKRECVPEKGPFLTELSWDIHIANVRFVFRKRDVFGQEVNWFLLYGGAPESSIPLLVHFFPGQIDAKLCAFNKCNEKIERAWFKKQDRSIQAVLSIVPVEDIGELRKEALEPESLKPLAKAVPRILPCLLYVKIIAHDNFTYTCECTVRGQDAGGTSDEEFYLSLPLNDLLQGKRLDIEFPFTSDAIDSQGTLSLRFIPAGTIKK